MEIRLDKNRLLNNVTVDDYIAMSEGDVRTIKKVLSMFVAGEDGQYLPMDEAEKLIGKLSIKQMLDLGQSLGSDAEDTIVPKVSRAD